MIDHVILEAYEQSGKVIFRKKISQGQRLSIGRTHHADIPFTNDGKMSTKHFSMEIDNDDCIITDLNSTNGTFLNGKKVQASKVSDGDHVEAGQTKFKVCIQRLEKKPLPPSGGIQHVEAIPAQTVEPLVRPAQEPDNDISGVQKHENLQPIDWGSSTSQPLAPQVSPTADSPRATSEPEVLSNDSNNNLTTGPIAFADDTTNAPPVPNSFPVSIKIRVVVGIADELEKTIEVGKTGNEAKLTVGRGVEADWEFKSDGQLSRQHFEVELVGTRIILRDLNSRNGTFLNDDRISVETLKHHDQIRAGETIFMIDVKSE